MISAVAVAVASISAPQVANAQAVAAPTDPLGCMTAAIYYEAAREPDAGQQAVARVVLNRLADPAFPKSVCEVIFQGSARRSGCQFTFTCDGAMLRRTDPALWNRAASAAQTITTRITCARFGRHTCNARRESGAISSTRARWEPRCHS